jgi:hypothetical protein
LLPDWPGPVQGDSPEEVIRVVRVAVVLAVLLSLVSMGWATLTPARDDSAFDKQSAKKSPVDPSSFVVTKQTEILLDGKSCKYAEIPEHAVIVKMEVAADKKTLLRIHFRTPK